MMSFTASLFVLPKELYNRFFGNKNAFKELLYNISVPSLEIQNNFVLKF
jgi:hypothetical protein